ncbi:hypothetical protein [Actinoplanes rectilineatus]|uniref:hypothetical protein n=1 Tax=Actinoplanes rectilineatus TaxID=113571 RepID=UPI0006960DC2|nr:hypothetical protein [Actinoplanes rectilineatus]
MSNTDSPTRVLDASALVELFADHPRLMQLLDLAADGRVVVAVPALAVAEAQVVLAATPATWDYILTCHGVTELPLSVHTAVAPV